MRIFLHDEDCEPLGIVSLDWDVDQLGPWVRIPIWPNLTAKVWQPNAVAHLAQPAEVLSIMEIHISPLRYKRQDGTVSQGWIGVTKHPELCETFFQTKFR